MGKNNKRNQGLSRILGWVLLVTIVGFLVSIAFMVIGRYGLVQQLNSLKDNSNNLDVIEKILENYSKMTSNDTLSLFYTVITTVVFSFGIKVYSDMQRKTEDVAYIVQDLQDEIYLTTFHASFVVPLSLIKESSNEDVKRQLKKIYSLREILQEISGQVNVDGAYPHVEIKKCKSVSDRLQTAIIKDITEINDGVASIERKINADRSELNDIEYANMNDGVREISNICSEYLLNIKNIEQSNCLKRT